MILNIVKSNELKWLPNGSELIKVSGSSTLNSTSKPETYTSFTRSQEIMPEFANSQIGPKHPDIIISKLGPGQVRFNLFCAHSCCIIGIIMKIQGA